MTGEAPVHDRLRGAGQQVDKVRLLSGLYLYGPVCNREIRFTEVQNRILVSKILVSILSV